MADGETLYVIFKPIEWFEKYAYSDQDGDFWINKTAKDDWDNDTTLNYDRCRTCCIHKAEIAISLYNPEHVATSYDNLSDIEWGVKSVATEDTHPQFFV